MYTHHQPVHGYMSKCCGMDFLTCITAKKLLMCPVWISSHVSERQSCVGISRGREKDGMMPMTCATRNALFRVK